MSDRYRGVDSDTENEVLETVRSLQQQQREITNLLRKTQTQIGHLEETVKNVVQSQNEIKEALNIQTREV